LIGTAGRGIYVDGAMVYNPWTYEESGVGVAKNVLIIGNNYSGLNTTVADIVLGEKSMNCTVVGNGNESVIDNGTDNNITSMKKRPGGHHTNPIISDKFRMMHRIPRLGTR
jgi:hypothetical protein